MKDFAQKLKEARAEAKITQECMADRMQIPKRTIEDWEGGKRTPPSYVQRFVLNELEQLAKNQPAIVKNETDIVRQMIKAYETRAEGETKEKAVKGSKKQ